MGKKIVSDIGCFFGGKEAVFKKFVTVCSALFIMAASGLTLPQRTHAAGFNPMNMMNPSKWFGGRNRDYYDDYDRYGPGYGGYGPGYGGYGPGYGGYGPGYGGYGPGYGGYGPGYSGYYGPGYAPGYGAPGHGYLPAPAYAAPTQSAPKSSDTSNEIRELQDRIQKLERSQGQAPATTPSKGRDYGGFQGDKYPEGGYTGGGFTGGEYPSVKPTYRPLGQ